MYRIEYLNKVEPYWGKYGDKRDIHSNLEGPYIAFWYRLTTKLVISLTITIKNCLLIEVLVKGVVYHYHYLTFFRQSSKPKIEISDESWLKTQFYK